MSIVYARAFGLVGTMMLLVDIYLGILGIKGTGLLAVLGLVFVMLGVREIANESGNSKIYRDYLIYLVVTMLFFLLLFFLKNLENYLVVLWILLIIGSIFLRSCFNQIETISGISMFRYAALVYIFGAVLFIVFVGLILLPLAIALQALAFFSLPEAVEQLENYEEYESESEVVGESEESL